MISYRWRNWPTSQTSVDMEPVLRATLATLLVDFIRRALRVALSFATCA